jgi:2-iminobutanoate/2-iminopropanoate deaminase
MPGKREVVIVAGAPKPIGPYSPAIRAGNFVYASGSLGVDPATGSLVPGGIEAQTRQSLENLAAVLEAGGASLASVVKTTVFLQDIGEFAKMNAVYAEFFSQKPPARSAFQVAALPAGAAVEIEAIALVASE